MDQLDLDLKTRKRVEDTVIRLLNTADFNVETIHSIRCMASKELGIDLSLPGRKQFVKHVINSFGNQVKSEEKEEVKTESEKKMRSRRTRRRRRRNDDEGCSKKKMRRSTIEGEDEEDILICKLSNKRMVTVRKYRGVQYVCIRDYFSRGGELLPTQKGVNMTVQQWKDFSNLTSEINKALDILEENSTGVAEDLGPALSTKEDTPEDQLDTEEHQ